SGAGPISSAGRTAARFAQDEHRVRWHELVVFAVGYPRNSREDSAAGQLTHSTDVLVNHRHGGSEEICPVEIIESDDGHVLRNTSPMMAKCSKRAVEQGLICREDCPHSRCLTLVKVGIHGFGRATDVITTLDNVDAGTYLLRSLEKPTLTRLPGGPISGVLDEGPVRVTVLREVEAHLHAGPLSRVENVRVSGELFRRQTVDEDDRYRPVREEFHLGELRSIGAQDTRYPHLHEGSEERLLSLRAVPA